MPTRRGQIRPASESTSSRLIHARLGLASADDANMRGLACAQMSGLRAVLLADFRLQAERLGACSMSRETTARAFTAKPRG